MKRNAKTKEAKGSKQPKTPKLLKEPKPRIPRKPAAKQKTQAGNVLKSSSKSRLAGTKRKKNDQGEKDDINVKNKERDFPEGERDDQSGPNIRAKEEVRLMTIYVIVL